MTINKKIVILLSLLFSLFLNCNQNQHSNSSDSPEVQFVKDYVILFQTKNYEAIKKSLDPKLLNQQLQPQLEKISGFIPAEQPKKIDLIGLNTFRNGDLYRANITFQYEFSSSWLLVNVVLEKIGEGKFVVMGFNVNPIMDSLANSTMFSFKNKTLIHYIILILTIIIPVFIVVTLIFCIITPMQKKWLWILFILLGFGKISFNWTYGDINFQVLSVQLFGSGFVRSNNFAPWILFTSIPLGGILFWIKRAKLKQMKEDDKSESSREPVNIETNDTDKSE